MSEEKELKCSNCGKHLSDCDKSCYYQEEKELDSIELALHCKSLESRLKEAQKELERLYEFERSVTPQIKAINEERFQEVFNLKERLSQAEAEVKFHHENFVSVCNQRDRLHRMFEEPQKNIEELEARLSHLMDVAGKMAIVVDGYVCRCGAGRPPDAEIIHGWICKEAKLALAEWDGIKKESL